MRLYKVFWMYKVKVCVESMCIGAIANTNNVQVGIQIGILGMYFFYSTFLMYCVMLLIHNVRYFLRNSANTLKLQYFWLFSVCERKILQSENCAYFQYDYRWIPAYIDTQCKEIFDFLSSSSL